MKRFIKNLLIFVIVLSTITVMLNFLYGKAYEVDPITKKFATIPDTLQICNFGPSYGMYAFKYDALESEYDYFNFGLSGQTLSYDYRLFQYYGDHIVEGTVVFIPVSYNSLFGVEEVNDSDFLSKSKRYYSILPASLIKEYDHRTDLYTRYLPALASSTNELIETLLGIDPIVATMEKSATDIDVVRNAVAGAEMLAENKKKYYKDGNLIENQEEIDALYALVRGCQEKGAVPVLITTPFLREYTDAMKENAKDFYDHFYMIINRVVKDTGVEYYDYSYDERFADEHSWFRDSTHLNKEGAGNFINTVMHEIVYAKGYLDK